MTSSCAWPFRKICLRNPVFHSPAMMARSCPRNTSSGTTIVPGMPRWLYGCDPYHTGSATVQPVLSATCSAMRVTRNVSSPSGCPAPWFSVLPTGTMMRSLRFRRSLISVMFMVW